MLGVLCVGMVIMRQSKNCLVCPIARTPNLSKLFGQC